MPPPLVIDLDQVDLGSTLLTRDQIYEILPQRYEFQVLSGVIWLDKEGQKIVAYADVSPEDWWVRGHIPNRPLLPGVLMLEMAAQTSAVAAELIGSQRHFYGFGGVEACKFRATVVPPTRLIILCVGHEYRPRRIISRTQGVVDGQLVFEANVTGVVLK